MKKGKRERGGEKKISAKKMVEKKNFFSQFFTNENVTNTSLPNIFIYLPPSKPTEKNFFFEKCGGVAGEGGVSSRSERKFFKMILHLDSISYNANHFHRDFYPNTDCKNRHACC